MSRVPRKVKKMLQDITTNLVTLLRHFCAKLFFLFSLNYFTDLKNKLFINSIYKKINTNEAVIKNVSNEVENNVYSQENLEEMIEELVELGYDWFLTDKTGITPIMYTVNYCYKKLTEHLLYHFRDIDINNNIFNEPVYIEKYVGDSLFDETYGDSKLIQIVNAYDPNGNTALNYAINNTCFDIACMLLLHGADISFLETESQKALLLYSTEEILRVHYTEQHELSPVVGLLVIKVPEALKGSDINCDDYIKLLRRYLSYGHSKVVASLINSFQDKSDNNLLLNEIFDPDNESNTLCDYDYLKLTQYLFEQKTANELDSSLFPARRPLYFSASKGYLETFEYFVKKLDDNDESYYSFLMETAISENNFNIVEYLWNNHKYKFVSGNTPLHSAAREGSLKMVKYFCENGADINKGNDFGYTPLDKAIRFYHPKVIKYLISVCHVYPGGGTRWYPRCTQAVYNEKVQKISHLQPEDLKDDHEADYLLLAAVMAGDLPVMESLVAQGANINHSRLGIAPLHLAVRNMNSDTTKFLLQHGAVYDIKFSWMTMLDLSIYHNRLILKIVDVLFKSSSLVQDLKTAIQMLVSHDDAYDQNNPMVFLMNVKNHRGQMLLHKAVILNDKDAIELLLKYNKSYVGIKRLGLLSNIRYYVPINTVSQDFEGNTPLHLAAQKGNIEIASLLIRENPDSINIKNNIGHTPISLAEHHKQEKLVEFLLEKMNKPRKGVEYNRILWIDLLI